MFLLSVCVTYLFLCVSLQIKEEPDGAAFDGITLDHADYDHLISSGQPALQVCNIKDNLNYHIMKDNVNYHIMKDNIHAAMDWME